MKKIVILGATGSLGTQMLEVIGRYTAHAKVIGLSGRTNRKLLRQQARTWSVPGENCAITGKEIARLATLPEADIVVNVLPGTAGIEPTLAALKQGKTLLLGNKESLVAEGRRIMQHKNHPIPLDSEHNAIYEILKTRPRAQIRRLILPCSGGPFLGKTAQELAHLTAQDALRHPRWSMGKKVSLESATLINKGFEIIEAHYLFATPLENIDVFVHPECTIHAIVEFTDGTSLGYLAKPDMREHLENALCRALALPLPPRQILPMHIKNFRKPAPPLASGITLVLERFQKEPHTMRQFLGREEKLIARLLDNKITFSHFRSQLAHL